MDESSEEVRLINRKVAVAVGVRDSRASPNVRQSRTLISCSETRQIMDRGRAVDKVVPESGLVTGKHPGQS